MKLGDLTGALLDADFALRETDGNAKAFFRQGQVCMDLSTTVIISSLCFSPTRTSASMLLFLPFFQTTQMSYYH